MHVAFLCSSLEAGRDGVGDYCRLLSGECERQGTNCSIIALNDRHVTKSGSPDASSLRLSSCTPWNERVTRAKAFLGDFKPDWVSLQFVPYGFQDKGVVAGFCQRLRQIIDAARNVHIMAHELWIGAAREASLKDRAIGLIQKHYIAGLFRSLRPRLVTTSNDVYISMLRQLGIDAKLLPLFGNIPVETSMLSSFSERLLREYHLNRDAAWVGLFFGTIHAEWKAEPLLGKLLDAASRAGKRLCLVGAGRLGAPGELQWERMVREYADRITWIKTGELAPGEISELLAASDFGIATSPWELLGKSGTAAAMIDHGLPMYASRDDWHLRSTRRNAVSNNPLMIRVGADSQIFVDPNDRRILPVSRLETITGSMLSEYQLAAA